MIPLADVYIIGMVLTALFAFYVMWDLYKRFFCKDACDEYTEYSDELDNDAEATDKEIKWYIL